LPTKRTPGLALQGLEEARTVIFLEQIDKQNVRYLREAVSEERICTYVTVKLTSSPP
jgi:hypothetical protein